MTNIKQLKKKLSRKMHFYEILKSVRKTSLHIICSLHRANNYFMNQNFKEQDSSGTLITISRKHNSQYEAGLPKEVFLKGVTVLKISCGWDFGVFLGTDNCMYSFGANEEGQLGDGTFESSYSQCRKVKIKSNKSMTDICCGSTHAIAYNSKEAFGWGEHKYGALGHEASQVMNASLPRKVPLLIGSDEELWGVSAGNNISVFNVSGSFYGVGNNQSRELGLLLKRISYEPELIRAISNREEEQKLANVQCGDGFTIGLGTDGKIYGSGEIRKLGLAVEDISYFSNGLYPLTGHKLTAQKFKSIWCSNYLCLETQDGNLMVFGQGLQQKQMIRNFIVEQESETAETSIKQIQFHNKTGVVTTSSDAQYTWGRMPELHKFYCPQNAQISKISSKSKVKLFKNGGYAIFTTSSALPSELPYKLPAGYKTPISIAVVQPTKTQTEEFLNSKDHAQEHSSQKQSLNDKILAQHKEIQQQKQIISLYEQYVQKLETENKQLKQRVRQENAQSMVDIVEIDDKIANRLVDLKYLLGELLQGVKDK